MKYAVVFAGATLASFAQGQFQHNQRGGIHARQHAHEHAKKDIATTNVVEWVTVTVTAGAGSPSANYDPPSSVEAASSSIPNVGEKLQKSSQPASSVVSSSVAAAPTAIPTTSTQIAPVQSSSSSAAASSAVSSASSSAAASASGISLSNLTPNGKKAGLSGYDGIQTNAKAAFSALAPHISWYSDYTATTETTSAFPGVMGIPMLWGASGSACTGSELTNRLNGFKTQVAGAAPKIMFGFYEPDCTCTMSSQMSVSDAASDWNSLIAPLAAKGTILGSPSMCKQKDEDFLTPFKSQISTTWDVTSIHVNKNSIDGVKEDVEYYVQKYGKPVFVSEFACVDDKNGFTACTDQGQINTFINQTVAYFESNKDVIAYGASNGEGLGTVWPLTTSSGALSATGQAYLNAIQRLS